MRHALLWDEDWRRACIFACLVPTFRSQSFKQLGGLDMSEVDPKSFQANGLSSPQQLMCPDFLSAGRTNPLSFALVVWT